ncbi:MAG: hypothetical protein KAI98_07195, partial [Gemmatimonadetes bacterium]|nr:hypothetical protein [Gemmatimonadota bacterium]
DLEGDDLSREFAMLESTGADTNVDEKLLALKRDMGLIAPVAAAERPRALGSGEVEVADAEILDEDEPDVDDAATDEVATDEATTHEVDEPKE